MALLVVRVCHRHRTSTTYPGASDRQIGDTRALDDDDDDSAWLLQQEEDDAAEQQNDAAQQQMQLYEQLAGL
jgi:hypothetical protein